MPSPVLEYAPPPTHPRARRILVTILPLAALATLCGLLGSAAGESLARRGSCVSTAIIQCSPPLTNPHGKRSEEFQDPQPMAARRFADHCGTDGFLDRLSDSINAAAAPDRPATTPTDLRRAMTVEHIRDTKLIRLTAADANTDRAKAIATQAGRLALQDYRHPDYLTYMWFSLPDPGQTPPRRIRDFRLAGGALGATLAPLAACSIQRRIRRHRQSA